MNRVLGAIWMVIAINIGLSAQNSIKGVVQFSDQEPVVGAVVSLKALPDSTFVGYSLTDAFGSFEIASSSTASRLLLEVKQISIAPMSRVIDNQSQSLHLVAKPSADFDLEEVVINTQAIVERGDTLTYLTSNFSSINDQSIKETLAKMPGIQISESGTISYNGKQIKQFQIEGMDLFDGKYGIAMERIRPEDIASVQVLRNFQPLKVLQESRPKDDVALNLILKDNAKSVFSLENSSKTGLEWGKRWLYNTGLTASIFTARHQSFLTFEVDNMGGNPKGMYADKFLTYIGGNQLTSVTMPTLPMLSDVRYRRNRSLSTSYHGASKLSEDSKLKYSALYVGDRNSGVYDSRQLYTLYSGETINNHYTQRSEQREHLGEVALNYDRNEESGYLSNRLAIRVDQSNPTSAINGVIEGNEEKKLGAQTFLNRFRMIRKLGEIRGFDFRFDTSYLNQSECLQIFPVSASELLYQQDVRSKYLGLDARLELLSTIRLGDLVLDPYAFITWDKTRLNSHLMTSELTNIRPVGSLDYSLFRSGLGLSIHYSYRWLRLEGYLPIMYWNIGADRDEQALKASLVRFEPNLSLRANLSRYVSATLSGQLTNSFNPAEDFLQSVVVQNIYRIKESKVDRIAQKRQYQATSQIEYRNPFSRLFGLLYLKYNNLYSDMINHLKISKGRVYQELTPHSFNSHLMSVGTDLSKSFIRKKGLLALGGNYSDFRSESMHNEELIPFANSSYQIYIRGSVKPMQWLELDTRVDWMEMSSRRQGEGKSFGQQQLLWAGHLMFYLAEGLTLQITEEYARSFAPNKSTINLTDLSLLYRLGRTTLSLDLNNITNTQLYETYIIGSNSSQYSAYHLRPRSIVLGVRWNIL